MSSTSGPPSADVPATWRKAGLRYHTLRHYFDQRFGGAVRKISVDAGLSCPNVDGTLSRHGCVFCNPASFSPSRRRPAITVAEQVERGVRRMSQRCAAARFIAYFQPGTNTHAPPQTLDRLFRAAADHPDVVGIAVGTRPDCLADAALEVLARLAARTWLQLELGLQSIHDRSLVWMNRGHDYQAFLQAVGRARRHGLRVGAHVILGLPGESPEDMLQTAREIARLKLDSVKLHNLHVVEGTRLAAALRDGRLELPSQDAYVDLAIRFLERLPPECVIDRVVGHAPAQYLVAPAWCLAKPAVLRAVDFEMERRQTWQGRLCMSGPG